MCLLAVFQILLFRYSGQRDLSVGTPVAGRTRVETEGLIGCFINTIVVRVNCSGNPPFSKFLKHVRDVVLTGYEHQDIPFEKVVQELRTDRDLNGSPLFQVMFDFDQSKPVEADLEGVVITHEYYETGMALFDLGLFIRKTQQGLECGFEYNTNIFLASTIERLGRHWQQLLESIIATPEQLIGQLPLLSEDERRQLLVEWNQTAVPYPRDTCIHEMFEAQVANTPEALAVVCGQEGLTYKELNHQANQVAHYLQKKGVVPDMRVGLCFDQSCEMMVGLLGILKAGGAYVPLDPSYPTERLEFMLQDAQIDVLVTQSAFLDKLCTPREVVCIDGDWELIEKNVTLNPQVQMYASHLAYVMYTSGSTGQPKGVCVEHRAVIRLIKGTNYATFSSEEVFLHLAPLAFDASTFEIWGALLHGAQLILLPARQPTLDEIGTALCHYQVTTLWLTAGLFHVMVSERIEDLKSLRQLLAGGDVLSVRHVEKARRELTSCRLVNGYGPTEGTTFSCCYEVPMDGPLGETVSIGRPIANTTVYILDSYQQPVPIGVAGELYIGGEGLARGYLNCPELTVEKFLPHPFDPQPGARVYRTGDRVRYRPEGNIEFLGRLDHQIKLRGYRIEPGEIEATLEQHSMVRQAIVVERPQAQGDKRLIAYLVAAEKPAPSKEKLREALAIQLPLFMIPSEFVWIDAIPLTPNGKIDRTLLPVEGPSLTEVTETYLAPRNPLESELALILEEILGRPSIGMNDNFFDIGGHSLNAVQFFSRIQKKIGKTIPLSILFKAPTIKQLCSYITNDHTDETWKSLVPIQPKGSKTPIFLVHGVGGNVLTFANLSSLLGPDQPMYGLQSVGLNCEETYFDRIEDMASFYLQEMQSVQPHGPYYLGGACMGGLVAFEMAQQLQDNGKDVAFLGLFDTWLPMRFEFNWYSAPRMRFLETRLWNQIECFKKEGIKTGILQAMDKLKALPEMIREGDVYKRGDEAEKARALVSAANFKATKNYIPMPYKGKISYFMAATRDVVPKDDTRMEWTRFASGGFECIPVPASDTGEMFEFPYVQTLAGHVKSCLEWAQTQSSKKSDE